MNTKPLAIGIDASTQGVKALALGPDGVEALGAVNFGKDLPQYGAPEGFVPDPDPTVRRADPRMWEEGVRLALRRLGAEADLSRAGCVAGAAQQHGLVCTDAAGALALPLAPIWMDRSTGAECAELEARFGAAMRDRTGSAATERFTGPQARKASRDAAAWARTARADCVASWLNSRLVGGPAPCDPGSASGQNLMDLATREWDAEIASFTAPGLPGKLPRIVPSDAVSGTLCASFAEGGLRAGIPVVVWSGDNPDSLLGMGCAEPGAAVASLGTSDTFFAAMESPRTDPEGFGNVFCTSAGGYMSLLCFTNGALARDRVRREAGVDWDGFNAALRATAPGNGGRLMLPWFSPESVPRVVRAGARRSYDSATPAEEIRALCEGQALAMRLHSRWIGAGFARLGVTGGGSKSDGFLRILADVFQTPVERLESTETVALGAAMRAWAHLAGEGLGALAARLCRPAARVEPDPAAAGVYADALARYEAFERAERER